ncbi:hypothetical protein SCAR479_10333 [Seiridium cardinale]|uniref:Rhodopsin domain-containing protein n=1 Tax=Seiridium cardinale TaxID=138064 RepID=A0ABR2XGQ9_9PEZI
MSTNEQTKPMPPPAVPYTAYVATIWAFVAVSGITLICRLIARFRGPRRLFWDDGFVIFPWTLSLVTAATWQWAARDMYYIMNVQAGLANYDPSIYMTSLRNWLNASLIAELFFYTALFSIKLSFLFFFRRLSNGISHFRYIWWPVLIVTVGSYLGAIGNVDYKCLVGTIEQITGVCQQEHELQFTTATLKANAALDVFTDFMSVPLLFYISLSLVLLTLSSLPIVMLLPTILVWNTRIRTSKKLALIGLFSLSIITIVIAIVRAIMVDSARRPDGNPDVTWLWFWSAVEPSVVCCGSAFPQLFTPSMHSSKKLEFSPSETFLRMKSRIRSSRKHRQAEDDTTWLDLTAVSRNSLRDFDNHSYSMVSDHGHRSSTDPESGYGNNVTLANNPPRGPMLVPRGPGPIPAAHTYIRTPSQDTLVGPENQISEHFEFETRTMTTEGTHS